MQAFDQNERNLNIQYAREWRDEAQKWYDNRLDELELYNFKLDLKKGLLDSATDDNREQY
jgi:hypothetical protein